MSRSLDVKAAYLGIVLFGIVSLVGDTIYEGGRGIIPSYLAFLGASAFVIGASLGLSEFLGYVLRLVSGVAADTTRAYWTFYIVGYILTISIPLLAFSWNWQIAVLLVFVERIAKAIRSPSRDYLLSIISKSVGAGKAFGLHELFDQLGAVLGPSIIAYVLFSTSNNYSYAFKSLLIPYLILVFIVLYVVSKLKIGVEGVVKGKAGTPTLPPKFKYYVLAVTLNTIGLIHVSLILLRTSEYVEPWMVSLTYLLIQGVDAVSALASGVIYDKVGRLILILPFALSPIPSILTVMGGLNFLIISAVVFGILYGMQESIYRAAIVDLAPVEVRGSAYGLFNSTYGLGLFISGSIYGWFISSGLIFEAAIYALTVEIIAIYLLVKATL